MKKLIVVSAAVLSLGLFSFIMPKPSSTGVWLTADGNYQVDDGACLNFAPADQQSVTQLIQQIYNIDVSQLDQDAVLAPMAAPSNPGGVTVIDHSFWRRVFTQRCYKWDAVSAADLDQNETDLVKIIDQYAQPLN